MVVVHPTAELLTDSQFKIESNDDVPTTTIISTDSIKLEPGLENIIDSQNTGYENIIETQQTISDNSQHFESYQSSTDSSQLFDNYSREDALETNDLFNSYETDTHIPSE